MHVPESNTLWTPAEVEKRLIEALFGQIKYKVGLCDFSIDVPDRYPQKVVDAVVEALKEKGWHARSKQYRKYRIVEWSKSPFPESESKKSWWRRVSDILSSHDPN